MSFDKNKQEVLLGLYQESSQNSRLFINLRFRHFTTFVVLTALMATVAFKVPEVGEIQKYLPIFGIVLTVLFWFLDRRTYELFRKIELKTVAVEEALKEPHNIVLESEKKSKRFISANLTTNLIFTLILSLWSLASIGKFFLGE